PAYALPSSAPRDLASLANQDGSLTDWDGRQNGACKSAICGSGRFIRECDRSEMPVARFRVRLRSRCRCPGQRLVHVDGMPLLLYYDPGRSTATTTTLPGPCGATLEAPPYMYPPPDVVQVR